MIASHNRTGFICGVPGLMLEIGGVMLLGNSIDKDPSLTALGCLVFTIGAVLLVVGLVYAAKAKGYHGALGLLGLTGILGLIVLAVLPDRTRRSIASNPPPSLNNIPPPYRPSLPLAPVETPEKIEQ